MKSTKHQAISTIENAGKYLVKSRDLRAKVALMTATEAAHSSDPDMHAFAIFSVALADVTGAKHDGWVTEIREALGIMDPWLSQVKAWNAACDEADGQ